MSGAGRREGFLAEKKGESRGRLGSLDGVHIVGVARGERGHARLQKREKWCRKRGRHSSGNAPAVQSRDEQKQRGWVSKQDRQAGLAFNVMLAPPASSS